MTVSKKIKKIDNKIEKNKVQYDLDRQTAKSSALSSGTVSKYEFLTCKDVLPEKELLEKAATMKIFLVNTMIYHIQKEEKMENTYNLKSYFLQNIIIMNGLKMKN